VYLRKLTIGNFRKLNKIDIAFEPGLNILVGPNNVGKTAVIDALRALLGSPEEQGPRFFEDDIYRPKGGTPAAAIEFHYVFNGLDADDEADFLSALVPNAKGELEAHLHIRYADPDKSTGRLRAKRWCGLHEENTPGIDMTENLRGVYLPPLRDAASGLRPSRSSQLARLIHILADEAGRLGIDEALKKLDAELKLHPPLVNIQAAVTGHHSQMVGTQLAQALEVGLSGTDFKRFSSRLSLTVDSFEIEQNGLGFNNLIFMAVVLSELSRNQESAYRGLIVEEPEAHLHPQLQAVLLRYLENIKGVKKGGQISSKSEAAEVNGRGQDSVADTSGSQNPSAEASTLPVQVFVTSHSPNFASIAKLTSLVCLLETDQGATSFLPRSVVFGKGKLEKLERYLDVTRAEIFFARRIIFVEGAAELMLVAVLAQKCGFNLRDHAVSLISVALYPKLGDSAIVSDTTQSMLKLADPYVQVFHGLKTLEYDLALYEENRTAMIKTLKSLHPKIGAEVEKSVSDATEEPAKAKALFSGMFERTSGNVSKGRFGQALAQEFLQPGAACRLPDYIRLAIEHVCAGKAIEP